MVMLARNQARRGDELPDSVLQLSFDSLEV
jgi:hypothetical protein